MLNNIYLGTAVFNADTNSITSFSNLSTPTVLSRDTTLYVVDGMLTDYTPTVDDDPVPVTLTVTADGEAGTSTTTTLTLTFSGAVTDLAADNITLGGDVTVTKGNLTGSDTTYTLAISDLSATGNITVTVRKTSYAISGSPYTVAVHYNTQS